MDRKAAKELLHIQGWLERVDEVIERGKDAYLSDDLLQEAGDSLMMKLGEAANRLSRLDVLAPDGRILDLTGRALADARASAEGREGLSAFLEKRPPSWAP